MFVEFSVRQATSIEPWTPFGQLVAAPLNDSASPAAWTSLTGNHSRSSLRPAAAASHSNNETKTGECQGVGLGLWDGAY